MATLRQMTSATLPYSTDVVSKVGILKDFFVTLFFVGLGMGIPVPEGTSVIMTTHPNAPAYRTAYRRRCPTPGPNRTVSPLPTPAGSIQPQR